MRAVTGRYQKQKHIFRHSFKLSAIYHIIALRVNLAWTLNLDLLKRSDFPLNVDYILSGRGIIDEIDAIDFSSDLKYQIKN